MRTSELRNARDYNRGLPAPIRWAHLAAAAAIPPLRPIHAWSAAPHRRSWALPLLIGLLLVILLFPFDSALLRAIRSIPLGGDIRRELEAAQQYGQGLSILLIALVIYLQDPARRRRLADWAAAIALAAPCVTLAKALIGRPRPEFDEPGLILGPFGQYPIPGKGVYHAWEIWQPISARLWSMPSSHTAYAVVMAVFIGAVYPRLRILAWAIALTVAFARIWTGAHYPTDVIAGFAIGLAAANTAISRQWGTRLLNRLTHRPFPPPDPAPTPAP